MKRNKFQKTAFSVICVVLAAVMVLSLVITVLPAGAVDQTDLERLAEKRAQLEEQLAEQEQKRKEQHLSADEHYYCFTPQYVAGEAALLFKAGFAEVRVCWAKSNTAVLLATK